MKYQPHLRDPSQSHEDAAVPSPVLCDHVPTSDGAIVAGVVVAGVVVGVVVGAAVTGAAVAGVVVVAGIV